MQKTKLSVVLPLLGLSLIGGFTGCQTRIAGMTLPSPRYLDHQPQYFPPSPFFPLQNELESQERAVQGLPGQPGNVGGVGGTGR